ncbi:virion structural protein [Xanthomonas phage XaC1]|nr:virion structural protein [Xanthomonas phage XaC1]
MSSNGVYTYPHNQEATLGNFSMPFNNKRLVIYKGANNPLSFTIHNADGKYTLLKDNEYVVFSIFDTRNNTKIFESRLEKTAPSWVSEAGQARPTISMQNKVYYTGVVPAGIIQDLSPGTKYRWSIIKVQEDGNNLVPNTQYLYTGLNYEASAELEISTLAAPVFIGSVELSEQANASFLPIKDKERQDISKGVIGEYDVLGSTPVPSGVQYGLVDGLSTIAFYFDNFIGRYQLQGCLSNDVPKDEENYKWFNINLCGCDYIGNELDDKGVPIPINGIVPYNFKGNFMWVRVVVCIPPFIRTITPVTVRKEYNPYNTMPKVLVRR